MLTHPVKLYIYELSPASQIWCKHQYLQLLPPETTVLHTSVVVHETEYSYGEHGIEEHEPKLRPQCDDDDFEEAVSCIKILGQTELSKPEVDAIVKKMKHGSDWLSFKFNSVEHNCHHFSGVLGALLCGENAVLPAEIRDFCSLLVECREEWIEEFFVEERASNQLYTAAH